MGGDESQFNVSLSFIKSESFTTTTFQWRRRAEADSNRGLSARPNRLPFFSLFFTSVSLSRLPGFPSRSLAWYRHMTFSHRAGPGRFHLLQHPRVHHLADSTKARNSGRRAGNRGVIETSFSTARSRPRSSDWRKEKQLYKLFFVSKENANRCQPSQRTVVILNGFDFDSVHVAKKEEEKKKWVYSEKA